MITYEINDRILNPYQLHKTENTSNKKQIVQSMKTAGASEPIKLSLVF